MSGRADQLLLATVKVQMSVKGSEDEDESPPQMMMLPCGSLGGVPLPTRAGILATVDLICSA